jgi:hypothetical protein
MKEAVDGKVEPDGRHAAMVALEPEGIPLNAVDHLLRSAIPCPKVNQQRSTKPNRLSAAAPVASPPVGAPPGSEQTHRIILPDIV